MSSPDVSSVATSPTSHSEMDALLLGKIKELPITDVKSSNWKGTLISVLVIFCLCSVITFAIFVVSPEFEVSRFYATFPDKELLKLNEFLDGKYSAKRTWSGTWISNNEYVMIDKNKNFVVIDVLTEKSTVLVDASYMKTYNVQQAVLSPDRNYVLFVSNIRNVFRHTSLAQYKIFNINKPSDIITLRPPSAGEDAYLQAARWSGRGGDLVFVHKNNVYFMPEGYLEAHRLTQDTSQYIYNGIPDWIYEEEILAISTAFWFNSDGTKLAYAQFNDTEVDIQEYPWYGDAVDNSHVYLERVEIKYPKPGQANPTVQLYIVNLVGDEKFTRVAVQAPPNIVAKKDYYLTSLAWLNDDQFVAGWANREQNFASYSPCSFDTVSDGWKCVDGFTYKVDNGWLEVVEILPDPSGKQFYLRLPDHTESRNLQIYSISVSPPSSSAVQITSTACDVTQILKVIKKNDQTSTIFYMSTLVNKPGQRHMLTMDVSKDIAANQIQKTEPRIITLEDSNGTVNECLYNRVSLSEGDTEYAAHECLGPNVPYNKFIKARTGQLVRVGENNSALQQTLSNKLLPKNQTIRIPSKNNKLDLIVQLIFPPGFREEEVVKYPLLVYVYGGPGSQNVNELFKVNFNSYLAGARDIIIAYIDGRGSGYQGEANKYELFRKLGTVEIEDQITAARYLRDNKPYINKNAIGIWGWSYGGYATAMSLTKDNTDPVFACGISVAPVTSWLLYDSAYTERYMGRPETNELNYFRSDVIHVANNFKGKKYLLIHGTADDNVHVQNSMVLIKALNQANVMFQTQIYPDENHSLSGVSVHLYNKMEQFWTECFGLDSYIEEIGMRRRRIVKQSSSRDA